MNANPFTTTVLVQETSPIGTYTVDILSPTSSDYFYGTPNAILEGVGFQVSEGLIPPETYSHVASLLSSPY